MPKSGARAVQQAKRFIRWPYYCARQGLNKKSFIYGTDINTEVLKEARKGIYSLRKIKSYAENYQFTGLKGSITDHFTILYDAASIHNELKQNTLFSVHNLVSDDVFNEFQMISCRNVFIYFETLQERILELFYKSLCPLRLFMPWVVRKPYGLTFLRRSLR
jgi:chemotaxis protein methyltransferase CheR